MSPARLARLFAIILLSACAPLSFAQSSFNFVNNITQVPVPGVGHDYLHELSEIVNPANGSLSVRIEAPRPKERGLNYPFYAFMYDSTQQFNLQYQQDTVGPYSCGNDSAGDGPNSGDAPEPLNCVISVSFLYESLRYPAGLNGVLSGPNSTLYTNEEYSRWLGSASYMTCNLTQNTSYEDPYGVIHDLGAYGLPYGTNDFQGCGYLGFQDNPVGGDEEYKIIVSDQYSDITATGLIDLHGNGVLEDTNGNAPNGTGRSGLYQSFQPWGDALANPQTASRTFAGGATYNYTWGTTTTQFVPGYVDETKIQLGYDKLCVPPTLNASGGNTNPVVVQMQEPDLLYYTFSYDTTSALKSGLLSTITYPTGAYVQYTWGVNPMSDATGWTTPGQFVNSYNDPVQEPSGAGGINTSCVYVHDTPAVVKRVVSYDGVHPAMEQDFSYCTIWQGSSTCATDQNGAAQTGTSSWTSKQTTVTTIDLLSAGTPSFKTIYTYLPYTPYQSIGSHLVSSPIPVENTIVYQDTVGNVLRTVTKGWNYNNQLAAECTTLPNGKTSGTFYQYQPYPLKEYAAGVNNPAALTTNLQADAAEYDYGLVTTACQKPSTTPTRETVTTYANFANTPLWPTFTVFGTTQVSMPPMVDRPATVITYQNGTKVSETDYAYDQTAVASVSPTPYGHDETNYGNGSSVARGNLTTLTRKCFQGNNTCQDSVTKIAYDTTGQAVSVTDANQNQTTLSYADSYTTDDGSPSGNTNTYVTKIQRPTTNGVQHIETFQWDFNKGQLRSLTDENGNQTQYQYSDPWWRLTSSTFPDGGSITKTYHDAGPNPSVTANTLISNSPSTTMTTTTITDAIGHVIHTQLNSDPDGVTYVDTTYDGFGRVASSTNPYRSTSDPTYGVTTFTYDSLNRKTIQVQPDGSKLQWCYDNIASSGQTNCLANATSQTNATWVDSSDEAGNHWQRTSDAFGRLTAVLEPNGTSQSPSMETDYAYDGLNNLLCVGQKGTNTGTFSNCASIPASWRPRTFAYDSLSRLTSATNPESGTISYTYDANGNLISKTSPAPNQTSSASVTLSYCYDALNRTTFKNYTFSPGSAPTCSSLTPPPCGSTTFPSSVAAFFVYDCSQIDNDTLLQNTVGRMVMSSQIIVPGSNPIVTNTWTDYDNVGRIQHFAQCARYNCGYFGQPQSPGWWVVTNTYDYAGNLKTYTDANGNLFTQTFSGAGRPLQLSSTWSDSTHPATLVSIPATTSNPGYLPNGAFKTASLGNGLTETNVYNTRLQPCRMAASSSGAAPATCFDTNTGNVLDFSYGFGSPNNGNIMSWSASGNQTFSRSFSYDALNRLSKMTETNGTVETCKPASSPSSPYTVNWTIDAWGNLTNQNPSSTQQPNNNPVCSISQSVGANNQLAGYLYDAAGNMTSDGTNFYFYDAENRIAQVYPVSYGYQGTTPPGCTASGVSCYFYNAEGQRISKYQDAGAQTTFYIYDTAGEVVADTDVNLNWNETYIHFGGQLIGQYRGASTGFIIKDHLGSTRLDTVFVPTGGTPPSGCTVPSGTTYCVYDNMDYLPFGEQIAGSSGITHKFTGKERDWESGLDNFGARYDSSNFGRFMSPDPMSIELHRLTNPQSLNIYAYARNNPLLFVDPLGLEVDLTCADKRDCQTYVDELNSRKGAGFQTQVTNGKLAVVGDVDVSKLSDSEKALYNAITSTDSTATLNIVNNDGTVLFGRADRPGRGTVDVGDLKQLDSPSNSGGIGSGQAAAHEALEAFFTSFGETVADAHGQTNDLFPGISLAGSTQMISDKLYFYGFRLSGTIANTNTGMTIEVRFNTPIPRAAITTNPNAPIPGLESNRVTKVTCCGNQ